MSDLELVCPTCHGIGMISALPVVTGQELFTRYLSRGVLPVKPVKLHKPINIRGTVYPAGTPYKLFKGPFDRGWIIFRGVPEHQRIVHVPCWRRHPRPA